MSDAVQALGADWPGRQLPVMPGDLTQFLPQGLGLGVPMIVRPWDNPLEALSRPNFYGLDRPDAHPFRAAPTQEPSGGVIYFDHNWPSEHIRATLDVIGVHALSVHYAVFAASADDPPEERYLDQVRIIAKSALGHFFAAEEAKALPDQTVPIGDFVVSFIAAQRAKWSGRGPFPAELAGTLGGDGDWAKESLAFGFLVENTYWSVYRLWSRPWLATK
jgi:hypothetical protein